MTSAERQRQQRADKARAEGREPHRSGRPPSQPCGTVAAYKRHLRRGEQPCGGCRAAWAEWHRNYYHSHCSTIPETPAELEQPFHK